MKVREGHLGDIKNGDGSGKFEVIRKYKCMKAKTKKNLDVDLATKQNIWTLFNQAT